MKQFQNMIPLTTNRMGGLCHAKVNFQAVVWSSWLRFDNPDYTRGEICLLVFNPTVPCQPMPPWAGHLSPLVCGEGGLQTTQQQKACRLQTRGKQILAPLCFLYLSTLSTPETDTTSLANLLLGGHFWDLSRRASLSLCLCLWVCVCVCVCAPNWCPALCLCLSERFPPPFRWLSLCAGLTCWICMEKGSWTRLGMSSALHIVYLCPKT